MVFSNLLFIYAFLPLCMLFYILPKSITAKNITLLVFSLIFYTWGEPIYVLLLLLMTFFDWFFGILIEKAQTKTIKRLFLFFACLVNIGLIGYFKYTGFILTNVQSVFGIPQVIPQIALPIGISFYTFQLLSYVVDVYRNEVKAQKNFFWFCFIQVCFINA